jgi:hypothetical protein
LELLVGGNEGDAPYRSRCGYYVVGGIFIFTKVYINRNIGNRRCEVLQDIVARLKDKVDEGLIVGSDDQSFIFNKKCKLPQGNHAEKKTPR